MNTRWHLCMLVGLVFSWSTLNAQTITLILDTNGDGVNGLIHPTTMTTDRDGNLFVAGVASDNVFKVTPGGTITQIIDHSGDYPDTHLLSNPNGVATDNDGNVFVAGFASDNVFKVTPGGTITQIIDGSGVDSHSLDGPDRVATDNDGNVFVSGGLSNNVFKIAPDGTITQIIDGSGVDSHSLDAPTGVATDGDGNVFVTCFNSDNAFKITPSGTITQIIDHNGDGTNQFLSGSGVATDHNGNVFVSGSDSRNVFKIATDGTITQIIDSEGDGDVDLSSATDVATDDNGSVYVTSYYTDVVFKITPAGIISQIIDASGDGTTPLSAPGRLTTDSYGDVFVAAGNNDVFRISPPPVPVISSIVGPAEPTALGSPVVVTGYYTYPPSADSHSAQFDWGDGSSDDGAVTEDNGDGSATGSHEYAAPGVYPVSLTVTNSFGGSDTKTFEFVVVYDPAGAFVTGSGSIYSPPGAYANDVTLEGKATFGFQSKYKKGASTPSGKTRFEFKTGDLKFHSDSYDWLVIAGAHAKYKGVGTVNGSGNFGFMLTATDEKLTPSTDVDLFRIKIWDKDAGDGVIYDNKMADSDDSFSGTALTKGNIVVHKSKASKADVTVGEQVPRSFALNAAYPNPFNPSTTITFDVPEKTHVNISVFNMIGQVVSVLVDDVIDQGAHSVSWTADGLPSATYLVRMQTSDRAFSMSIDLVK